jgi:hypothetical protein
MLRIVLRSFTPRNSTTRDGGVAGAGLQPSTSCFGLPAHLRPLAAASVPPFPPTWSARTTANLRFAQCNGVCPRRCGVKPQYDEGLPPASRGLSPPCFAGCFMLLSASSRPVFPRFTAYRPGFTCFAAALDGKTPDLPPVMQASGQTSPVAVFGPRIPRPSVTPFSREPGRLSGRGRGVGLVFG